jgi:ubiquinol-cytochrome c reductase iron-sulfur subunit
MVVTAALALAGGGIVAAAWPLIRQMSPDAAVPKPEVTSLELQSVRAGQSRTIGHAGQPVIVRNRTRAEIEHAQARDVAALRDRSARSAIAPERADASDVNRVVRGHEAWLVLIAVCTKEACIVHETEIEQRLSDDIGWFCPCCASRYDLSGRVVSGPAPQNLRVPRFSIQGVTLRIG